MIQGDQTTRVQQWDVKVYSDGEEMETIRGLSSVQKTTLGYLLRREGIEALAVGYGHEDKRLKHEDIGAVDR